MEEKGGSSGSGKCQDIATEVKINFNIGADKKKATTQVLE